MKYIFSESQMRKLFEQSQSVLEPYVIKLFKFLNEEKKKHKKRSDLLQVIKNLSPYMGVPEGYELYLLELYLLNYREDGNYKDLTKDNFVDPRKMKGKVTPNTKADLYTIAQLPFRGSNLQAYWTEDNKGVPYYVVKSYNWYPVYIFKNNKWYETIDRYSSSTSKQMGRANPIKYNDELYTSVFTLTAKEMKMLEDGATHEEVMKNKLEKFKSSESELVPKRKTNVKQWSRYLDEIQVPEYKVKFKINSIDVEGDTAIVYVDIYDVLNVMGGLGIETDKNYLKGEMGNITKERVEDTVKHKLYDKLKPFIAHRSRWFENLPPTSKLEYRFNHLKK